MITLRALAPAILVALLLLPAMAAGLTPPLVGDTTGQVWFSQTLDDRTVTRAYIEVDSTGRPHIFYRAGLGAESGMYYLRQDDTLSWAAPEFVAASSAVQGAALDAQGRPHLAYVRTSPNSLYYAVRTASGWEAELVANGTIGAFALDSQERPHLLIGDHSKIGMWYAVKQDSGWHVEPIPITDRLANLAVDGQGRPHVSHYLSGGKVAYSTRSMTGQWTTTQIASGQGLSDIAVDQLGRVHISYATQEEYLAHAVFDGTIWNHTIIDIDSPTGLYIDIVIDPQLRPHIIYHQIFNRANNDDPFRGHLKYAKLTAAGTWTVETVDWEGLNGINGSLALDKEDQPHIAYVYWRGQLPGTTGNLFDLRYATPVATFVPPIPASS